MTLSPFEWTVIGLVAAAAYALIRFFLNRTLSHTEKKVDDNSSAIRKLSDEAVHKDEFDKTTKKLADDVEEIKQNYVTRLEHKSDLKVVKDEIQDTTRKLTQDVEEIKANYLTQRDFYRTQAKTDQQLEKIYDVVLQLMQKGDKANGRE